MIRPAGESSGEPSSTMASVVGVSNSATPVAASNTAVMVKSDFNRGPRDRFATSCQRQAGFRIDAMLNHATVSRLPRVDLGPVARTREHNS